MTIIIIITIILVIMQHPHDDLEGIGHEAERRVICRQKTGKRHRLDGPWGRSVELGVEKQKKKTHRAT